MSLSEDGQGRSQTTKVATVKELDELREAVFVSVERDYDVWIQVSHMAEACEQIIQAVISSVLW